MTSFALLLAFLVTVHKPLGVLICWCCFLDPQHFACLFHFILPEISSQGKGYLGHGPEEGGTISLLPFCSTTESPSNLTVDEVF